MKTHAKRTLLWLGATLLLGAPDTRAQDNHDAGYQVTIIAQPPTITTQPQSLAVNEGERATFSVTAFGIPTPRYQWFLNGQSISGAISNVYSIPSAQLSHAGSYRVSAINSLGSATSSPPAVLTVNRLDYGDAPDRPYPTLLGSDGARHIIVNGVFLGFRVDNETNGQPNATATGDDGPVGAPDDEDGVTFLTSLIPGQVALVQVVASRLGRLDAWIDFGITGSWAESTDRIFSSRLVQAGTNTLQFVVPATAKVGATFSRFRYSTRGDYNFIGLAQDGEVEDYRVNIEIEPSPLDFGDAAQNYPVTLAQDGARHAPSELRLGVFLDLEPDGQPSSTALGDDTPSPFGGPDDEDGVKFLTALIPGQVAQVEVTATLPGFLDAWVDFNINGSWADVGEQIFASKLLTVGPNVLSFAVPATATPRATFARFRLSSKGGLSFTGYAPDGEVEDYRIGIDSRQLDFGDAPQAYPTLLSNNGARHVILAGFYLGQRIDGEADGQPSVDALGDDGPAGTPDDEDGVRFLTPLVPGSTAQVEVTASIEGRLNAWVDFNINGSWADPGEQVFIDQALVPGPNVLTFVVPTSAIPRATYARFRFSRDGKISFDGIAPEGEVEDYRVDMGRPRECDQDCTGTDFWLTFPGNYAPDTNNPVKLTLCLVGSPGTVGQVTIPGLGVVLPFNLPATGSLIVSLPPQADLGDANDVVTKKGIHVVAGNAISVQGLNHVRYTTDGYLGLPTPLLGTEYLVASFANVHTGAPDLNGSQFAIVATTNNTTVRITPRIAVAGHPANVLFNVVLQAGETYQLRSTNDSPADLTGSLVESDKAIAVFGSHQCANLPSDDQWFCDYLVEELIPVRNWGRAFLTAPLATRANGDTFRILASVDGTLVSINAGAPVTVNRGEFEQLTLTAGATIVASQPVNVMQYANSSDFDLVTDADPFMVMVPPLTMYKANQVVCTAPSDFTAHYLNVITPNAAIGSLTTNSVVVPAAAFVPIGATAYSYARLRVGPGRHVVASPQPASVTVYGWAEYDSYAYPGCLAFGDTTPPVLTCRVTKVTLTLGTVGGTVPSCGVVVPDLRGEVQASDNCGLSPNTVPRQVPAPGSVVGAGVHPITLTVTDEQGNAASCIITLTVIDPGQPSILCPTNVIARCLNSTGGVGRYVVTARTLCSSNLPVTCVPPSGSFFPPGVRTVSCTASNAGQVVSCAFTVTMVCEKITVVIVNGVTTLSWANGTLESAINITGPWLPVPNAKSPQIISPTDRSRFFRLRFD